MTNFANFASQNLIFYSYFNCILLIVRANKSIILETSRSISLWINNKVNPLNLAFVIVLRFKVLTIRRDENDRSHSQVVIGKLPNSFKVKRIFGKASESALFSVTETESGKLFLNPAQFQKLNQRYNSASTPLKFGKSLD